MPLSRVDLKRLVKSTAESSIEKFFLGKDVKTSHVLDNIFPVERRIRSLIGGLETSLGTTVWEPLAKSFAAENGYTVCEKTAMAVVPIIPQEVSHFIDDFKKKKLLNPDLRVSNFKESLRVFIKNKDIKATRQKKIQKGEGVDVYLKKDGNEILIDIKTTQINAGSGPKFLETQLNWIAYRLLADNSVDVQPLLAFPFNPHPNKDFWKKEGGKVSPLLPKYEAKVANEFWDELSGVQGTTEVIFEAFTELGSSGFGKRFSPIFEGVSVTKVEMPPKDFP